MSKPAATLKVVAPMIFNAVLIFLDLLLFLSSLFSFEMKISFSTLFVNGDFTNLLDL